MASGSEHNARQAGLRSGRIMLGSLEPDRPALDELLVPAVLQRVGEPVREQEGE